MEENVLSFFFRTDDGTTYYYETKLSAYIYVDSDGTVTYYDGNVAPPPDDYLASSALIPAEMYDLLPDFYYFYSG